MKCPKCNKENDDSNLKCDVCGNALQNFPLDDKTGNFASVRTEVKWSKSDRKKLAMANIGMLIGSVIVAIVIGCFVFYDAFITKDYEATSGRLIGYENYHSKDGTTLCQGLYEYEVNGKIYTGLTKFSTDEKSFKETMKVKYNPDNPRECYINSNILFYGLMISIAIIIFDINSRLKAYNTIESYKFDKKKWMLMRRRYK